MNLGPGLRIHPPLISIEAAKRSAHVPDLDEPYDWKETSPGVWVSILEAISSTRWLYCCRRPEGYVPPDASYCWGWIYVFAEDQREILYSKRLHDKAPLEMECICIELRQHYLKW